MWRRDTSPAAESRAQLPRRGLQWALEAIGCQHLTVSRVGESLGGSWASTSSGYATPGGRRGCWTWSRARSKQAFKTWLAAHDQAWRDQVEVVA